MLGLTGSALFAAILPHFLLVRLDGVLQTTFKSFLLFDSAVNSVKFKPYKD